MHIKYKNPLFWSRWGKKHHSSTLWFLSNEIQRSVESTFFPFVTSKEANPINFIISISSSVLPSKSYSVSSRSLLFVWFLSPPHLFFLSVKKGKQMWIYVVLGTWNAFCAGSKSGFFFHLSPWTGTFLGTFLGSLSRDVDQDCLCSLRVEQLWWWPIWSPSRTEKYLFRSSS